jgi:hypothetical protein
MHPAWRGGLAVCRVDIADRPEFAMVVRSLLVISGAAAADGSIREVRLSTRA